MILNGFCCIVKHLVYHCNANIVDKHQVTKTDKMQIRTYNLLGNYIIVGFVL